MNNKNGKCVDCNVAIFKWNKRCKECWYVSNRIPTEELFWRHTKKTTTCWIWCGARVKENGYGVTQTRINGVKKQIYAHRFSYEFHKGKIKKGCMILHKCDNPPCVNPNHLWEGTQMDNMRDASKKGRTQRGENHKHSKVTEDQVREMRSLYRFGKKGFSYRSISIKYGISPETMWSIVKRRTWKHVK